LSDAAAQQAKDLCFRGAPIERCRSFWIFEVTGARRAVGTSHVDRYGVKTQDLTEWVAWDLGYMRNRDNVHALGGSVSIGGSGGGTRLAARLRQRTWLTRDFTLDLSAGPLTAQQQSADLSGTKQGFGVTGEVTLGAKDLVGVTVAGDVIKIQDRTASALYVGGKVGSWGAVGASAAALLGVLALIAAFRNGID
jgi:hypothetical protein